MPALLSDRSRRLMTFDEPLLLNGGGGGFEGGGGGQFFALPYVEVGGGGGSPAPSVASAPPLDFDFDLSQIQRAVAKGNTEADVRSAYELFSTGQTSGRALQYAQSDVARFGYPSLRHAAAAYLDAAGLPRLARIINPDPVADSSIEVEGLGDFFSLPVPPDNAGAGSGTTATGDGAAKSLFENLADVFRSAFGTAVYNPPLQQQAYGYTPAQVSAQGAGGAGLGSIGGWLILGALAIAAYFVYQKVKGSA